MRLTLTEKLKNLEFYAIAASKYLNNTLKPSTIKEYSKELKEAVIALEIIEEKGLDIREFRYASSLYEYNICKNVGCKELTQEEYELLKEVL